MNRIYHGDGGEHTLTQGDVIQYVHGLIFKVIDMKCSGNMLKCSELHPETMAANSAVSWVPTSACWLLLRPGDESVGSPEFIAKHGAKLKPAGNRYGWSFDEDGTFSMAEGSIEEALQAARDDIADDEEQDITVFICDVQDYKPRIDSGHVIELLEEDAFETVGEVMEGWLSGATVEQKAELEKLITDWAVRHFPITFYLAVNAKEYNLATGQVVQK